MHAETGRQTPYQPDLYQEGDPSVWRGEPSSPEITPRIGLNPLELLDRIRNFHPRIKVDTVLGGVTGGVIGGVSHGPVGAIIGITLGAIAGHIIRSDNLDPH